MASRRESSISCVRVRSVSRASFFAWAIRPVGRRTVVRICLDISYKTYLCRANGAPTQIRAARPRLEWHSHAMRSTIDKAGRVGIPAPIRDRAGLTPGTALEVTADETGVRIERVAPGPKLVRIGKRLVARPTVGSEGRPDVDVAALIEDERNRWP